MKVEEVIDLIDTADSLYSLFDANEVLEECGLEQVDKGLNLEQHRWYSTATDVYKCEDGFVGIFGIFQLFSELMCYSDCGIHCDAFEMEQIPTVTYRIKKSYGNS